MRLGILLVAAALTCVGTAAASASVLPDERDTLAGPLDAVDGLLDPFDLDLASGSTALASSDVASGATARELHAASLLDGPIPLLPDDALLVFFDGSFGPWHVKVPTALASTYAPHRLTPRAPAVVASAPASGPSAQGGPDASDAADGAQPVLLFHSGNAAASSSTTPVAAPVTTMPPAARAAIAGAAGAAFLALLGIALYHRIRPNSALENDTRKTIFDAVCATPGLGVHAIAEKASVSYSTATYHLERLQAAGMIVMTPDGNKLCYYKNGGAFTETERRILPLLKNDEAIRLFEAILHAPGTYRAALAEQLGVTATTINWHLKRLRDAGLVHETRHGRNAYLYANTEALQIAMTGLSTKIPTTDEIVIERLRRYAAHSAAGGDASASS